MNRFNIHEAKTQLSRLVDRAARGEAFVIAKAGKPLVKVSALDAPAVHEDGSALYLGSPLYQSPAAGYTGCALPQCGIVDSLAAEFDDGFVVGNTVNGCPQHLYQGVGPVIVAGNVVWAASYAGLIEGLDHLFI